MGILTDLILATEEELEAVGNDDVPIDVLPGVEAKGMGLVDFISLHAILTRQETDPVVTAFPAVRALSEDGPWLNRLPDDLVARLAACDDADLHRIATEWSQTEELQRGDWQHGELLSRLEEMKALAQRALIEQKPLHLWMCL
jgi:hypothetical protein